jgi:putative sterol carrier protein
MIEYLYNWEDDLVFKVDRENEKYFAKRSNRSEVEVPFEHKSLQLALMSGEKITESQYNEF